jgi:hypothetical protein
MFKPRVLHFLKFLSFPEGLRFAATFMLAFALASPSLAQTTVSTGSIQATITDPTGAVVPGASVTITSSATGSMVTTNTSGAGFYSSGALIPGEYTVKVEARGFKTVVLPVTVQVGVTSPGNVQLELGQETTVISVEAAALRVNTEQATIQGVMTAQQISQLPIGGRNFLDLAQLEPGVQIQDGGNFDPSKHGFSSISLGGRFGRTARIEVDGVDISDECAGTTTQNIPMGAIQEFQISQSSLDLSTELTSSGAVNVATRAGTNKFHGESFILARSDKTAARIATKNLPFDRQQYGARFGGPLLKDRLFFFADWERTVQDLSVPVELPDPFTALSDSYNAPFHESMLLGRLDWQIKPNWRAFYRWTYDQANDIRPMSANSFQPFANRTNTPVQAAGLDGTMGNVSHTFRFGYMHFRDAIADASQGLYNPAPGITMWVGPLLTGPSALAPQASLQHNLQFKYDGSLIHGSHIIRYGISVNRILWGGFAAFFGLAPRVRSTMTEDSRAFAANGPFPGGISNPLNYPARTVVMGNGQGFFTEIPRFGYPAGGMFDTRFAWYVGDTWKVRPNFTLSYGLRYVRDTGRSDSDLPPLDLLNLWAPGLGNRVHQPNRNFAPQLGIAWDPWKNGKTVFRAGAGLYYENAVFNNILFDRPGRLEKGLFWGLAVACPTGAVMLPDGTSIDTSSLCNQPIGSVYQQLAAVQREYQAAVAAAGSQANPDYLGANMANGDYSTGNGFISPDYRTPFSWQFNVGVQRELRPGTVLSVDYVRNVGLRYLLAFDTNHIGDVRYLNRTAALNAIDATNDMYGCPLGIGGIDCAINDGATIVDYANMGLDSGSTYLSGFPASLWGLTPDWGAAFPGINPDLGENTMLFPIGRSVYNALQVSLRSNKANPFRGARNMSLQISYALSRFESMAGDQDFINDAFDFAQTNRYFGPSGLDRTHQLSFGGVFDFPYAFRMSFTSHIKTALPQTLFLPATWDSGEIFRTDVTGDGTAQDVVPGTNFGSFGRSVKVNGLNNLISNYDSSQAGQLTPAGQALVSAGLFTQGQLKDLGAVTPAIDSAPAGQVGLDSLLTTDLRIGWVLRPHRIWNSLSEEFAIEPTIAIYDLFNFANYDGPDNTLSGVLDGTAGSINGTDQAHRVNRVALGSGVYAIGAPRTFEFGLKLSF